MQRRIAKHASMYFSYGRDARPGLKSSNTFEAIVAGERTSTTRFLSWPGSQSWMRLAPGELVRFYEDKEMHGRSVDVEVVWTRLIDMTEMTDKELDAWSRVEGWSIEAAKTYAHKHKSGVQVLFKKLEA